MSEYFSVAVSRVTAVCLTIAALLAAPAAAQAQYVELQGLEIAPFIGARFTGTINMRTEEDGETQASLEDASSYGFSAGVRFHDFSLIEFRWTQSMAALRLEAPFRALGEAIGDVEVNQFHADFTREFVMPEVKGLRTFVTASVGATHLAVADDGFMRFSFGLGGGLKQFLGSRLAIRAEAKWLPIVFDPEVSGFACGTVGIGGCLVVLSGQLTPQFELSVGPVLRF